MSKGSVASLLIVDDQAEVRKVVRHVFERDGRFALAEAEDGDEALKIVSTTPPSAVILDISMPGQSGIALLPQLRELAPATSIVVLSSHAAMGPELTAMGADVFLPKVTPPKQLVRAVAELVGV